MIQVRYRGQVVLETEDADVAAQYLLAHQSGTLAEAVARGGYTVLDTRTNRRLFRPLDRGAKFARDRKRQGELPFTPPPPSEG